MTFYATSIRHPTSIHILFREHLINRRMIFQLKKSSDEGGFGFTDEEISWLGMDRTNSCKPLTLLSVQQVFKCLPQSSPASSGAFWASIWDEKRFAPLAVPSSSPAFSVSPLLPACTSSSLARSFSTGFVNPFFLNSIRCRYSVGSPWVLCFQLVG